MKRRLLSLLLAALMLLSLTPQAYAGETTPGAELPADELPIEEPLIPEEEPPEGEARPDTAAEPEPAGEASPQELMEPEPVDEAIPQDVPEPEPEDETVPEEETTPELCESEGCTLPYGHEGDCAFRSAEDELRLALETDGWAELLEDMVLTADLYITPEQELAVYGTLTVPEGVALSNGGTLYLGGAADVYGTLDNAAEAYLCVEQDPELYPDAAHALRLYSGAALRNAGTLETYGAVIIDEGAIFPEGDEPITVYAPGGSVEGSENIVYGEAIQTFGLGSAPTGITVTGAEDAEVVAVGSTLQMSATVTPDGADAEVTWTVTNGSGSATIDETTGELTAVSAGTVTVRAASASDSAVYGEREIGVGLEGEYILVLNTSLDPAAEQSTGTLVFGGGGASAVAPVSSSTYAGYSDISSGTTVAGYSVGDYKSIGYSRYICIGAGERCYVWMEETLYDDYAVLDKADTAAAEMMAVYSGRPYTALTTLAGGPLPVKDGTGKLSILMERSQSSGYFAGEDNITAIHINAPAAADYAYGELSSFAGLLAHEGQHALFQYLVCDSDAGAEMPLRWLNEGLAVSAMDWVWGGDGNADRGWLSTIGGNESVRSGSSLAYTDYRGESALDYGLPYLFVRYLSDQAMHGYDPLTACRSFYTRSFTGDVGSYMNSVLADMGLSDADGNPLSFTKALENFYIAAVVQAGSGVYGFYGDPVVAQRVSYPIFSGASGLAYTLPGTGAVILRTGGALFVPPADAGSDVIFKAFDSDSSPSQWQGSGTGEDPYQVNSPNILSAIALNPSGYYKLTQDIDVTGVTVFTMDQFTGTIDGDGHSITGLSSPLIYENYRGTIRNLNVQLDMDRTYSGYCGGLVCENNGTIENVHVSGSMSGSVTDTGIAGYAWAVGAVAGRNVSGTINGCSSSAAIALTLPAYSVYIGQIAGENCSIISNCVAAGSITASQGSAGSFMLYAGGLAGKVSATVLVGSLKTSYSITSLNVSASGAGNELKVGRLVGCEAGSPGRSNYIEACYGLGGIAAAGSYDNALLSDANASRTDAELRAQVNYIGWDFVNTWSMPANCYPVLGPGSGGTVTPPTVSGATLDYYIGEPLDLTGATVDSVPLTENMLYSVPSFDAAGQYVIRGSYQSQPFSFTVTVTDPGDLRSLTVSTEGRSSYSAGQTFDASGVVLTAANSTRSFDVTSGYTLSKTGALSQSDDRIGFTYGGMTAYQSISVTGRTLMSISRTGDMTRTYYLPNEQLSLAGLRLTLSYSDEVIDDVLPAQFSQYGLALVRYLGGEYTEIPQDKAMIAAEDDGAVLFVCQRSDISRFLNGAVRSPLASISVTHQAFMPDQRLVMHVGVEEYIYTDTITDGSYNYSTALISGTLPAGVTAIVPEVGYDRFCFYGTPTAQSQSVLVYRVTDTDQRQSFDVKIYLNVEAPSEECDILSASLSTRLGAPGVPCLISADTVSVIMPRGTDIRSLCINTSLSGGASPLMGGGSLVNGGPYDFSSPRTMTVVSQSGSSKTYTVTVRVASGSALAAPEGMVRTESTVSWSPVPNATGYFVTLYREGSEDVEIGTYYIDGTEIDMREFIEQTGTYFVSVRAFDDSGSYSAGSRVSSTKYSCAINPAPITAVTVFGSAMASVGGSEAYTAMVTPQDVADSSVTWSVLSGTGSADITQAGILTGTTAGTVTVRAESNAASGVAGELQVTIAEALPSGTAPVTVDVSDIAEPGAELWIDGVCYSGDELTVSGTSYTVELDYSFATNAVVFSYNSLTEPDPHKVYPTHMAVWLLSYSGGAYTAERVSEFDDLLRYSGSSIRMTGKKGIRMISSIASDLKSTLIDTGVRGYKLMEYGTVIAWTDEMNGGPLTLEQSYKKSGNAYRRGAGDPVFARSGGLVQYTNVLVGFSSAQCMPDLTMRPYIILQNDEGRSVTIYGGEVQRSIGYIAWQNRAVFTQGSAAYNYIWDIIDYCESYGITY